MSPRRTRRGTIFYGNTTPTTGDKEEELSVSTKKKGRPPTKKRNPRTAKKKVTSDSEDQLIPLGKKITRRRNQIIDEDSPLTIDNESVVGTPKEEKSFRDENSSESDNTGTPRHRTANRNCSTRVSTTPKSSPITVSLTPHRSIKTPRRSPDNLGSPKTHSDTPTRFSKTPRKLEIDETPPSSSEDSKIFKNQEPLNISRSLSPYSKSVTSSEKSLLENITKKTERRIKIFANKKEESDNVKKPTTCNNQKIFRISKQSKSPKPPKPIMSASRNKKSPVKLRSSTSGRKSDTFTEITDMNLRNTNSEKDSSIIASTPRERIRRSLNLSATIDDTSPFKREDSQNSKNGNQIFSLIENETGLVYNDSCIDLIDSDILQRSKDEKDKDGTYDLLEPKTPSLQAKKAKKRNSDEVNLSVTGTESKKVRFAENDVMYRTLTKLRSGTPGGKLSLQKSAFVRSQSRSPQRLNKGIDDQMRRRSSSMSVVEKTPVKSMKERNVNLVSTPTGKKLNKSQLASVNRLSRPRVSINLEKKAETKTPVPRKIPNFKEIHERNFQRMESLVDAKKRIENRHNAHSSIPRITKPQSQSSCKALESKNPSSEITDNAFNRFGFKIRRKETAESIAKKLPTLTSEHKRNARRDILKGVRTNRRFELQMQSRKSLGMK